MILIVIDRFIRFTHFFKLKHPFSTTIVANISIKNVVKLQEIPTSIINNQDPIFTSNFWQILLKKIGGSIKLSLAYHP
jgi:hypothetical protein